MADHDRITDESHITMTQITPDQLRIAGDRWRAIYETAVEHLGPDPDGSLFSFVVELIGQDTTDADLKAKTLKALETIASLRREADHQNATYRGSDFAKFIRQATGTPSLRTLYNLTQEVNP